VFGRSPPPSTVVLFFYLDSSKIRCAVTRVFSSLLFFGDGTCVEVSPRRLTTRSSTVKSLFTHYAGLGPTAIPVFVRPSQQVRPR